MQSRKKRSRKILTNEELKQQEYITMGEAERLGRLDRHLIHPWLITGEVEGYQLRAGGWWKIKTKSFLKKLELLTIETRSRAI